MKQHKDNFVSPPCYQAQYECKCETWQKHEYPPKHCPEHGAPIVTLWKMLKQEEQ